LSSSVISALSDVITLKQSYTGSGLADN